jgi:hypothetical protein
MFTNPEHPEWGEFPSPEMYSWALKSPKDQDRLRAKWAANPADWLTEFQRDQVNYDIPKELQGKVSKWADFVAKTDHDIRVYKDQNDIHDNTLEDIALKEARDKSIVAQAEKLGVSKEVAKFYAPSYERVGNALGLSKKAPSWDLLTQATGIITSYLNAQEISPKGDTAKPSRELLVQVIEALPKDDPVHDALHEIGLAVEKTNIYDLVDYLFFDMTY